MLCAGGERKRKGAGLKVRNSSGARNLSVERCCRSEMAIVDFGGWLCSAAGYSESCFCGRDVVEH